MCLLSMRYLNTQIGIFQLFLGSTQPKIKQTSPYSRIKERTFVPSSLGLVLLFKFKMTGLEEAATLASITSAEHQKALFLPLP